MGHVIVNTYADEEERAAVMAVNKCGGPEKIEDSVRWVSIGLGWAVLESICFPGIFSFLLLAGLAVLSAWIYTAMHRPLQRLKVRNQVVASDERLITLDQQWRAYIASMSDEIDAKAEDYRRFTTLRNLNELPEDERSSGVGVQQEYLASLIERR